MSSRALEAWIIAFSLLMHVVGRRHHTPALELLSRSRVLDDLRRSCIQRTPLKGLSEAIVLVYTRWPAVVGFTDILRSGSGSYICAQGGYIFRSTQPRPRDQSTCLPGPALSQRLHGKNNVGNSSTNVLTSLHTTARLHAKRHVRAFDIVSRTACILISHFTGS